MTSRFENRAHDLKEIAQRLGLDSLGTETVQNVSGVEGHYSEYYDPQTIAVVRHFHPRDPKLFGYDFEEGPPSDAKRESGYPDAS